MTASVDIQVLGPLGVTVDGAPQTLPKSRKTRALLTMLALEPEPHGRNALCEWIWPDTADPRAALRWSLTKLREVLADRGGPVLNADRDSVSLDWDRVDTDQRRLARILQKPDRTDTETLLEVGRHLFAVPGEDL